MTTYQPVIERPTSSRSLWWRRFWIRFRHWEYWPIYVFNIPVIFTWLWHAIKSGDLFFFTLTNPGIETGGFFGESKSQILKNIPVEYKPITLLLKTPVDEEKIDDIFRQSGLSFPVIAKPEVGERGWLIERINDLDELKKHLRKYPIDIILQSYIDLPLELSIMAYRMPDGSGSKVTSICEKVFLSVEGEGVSTILQLILAQDRAVLQFEKLRKKLGGRLDEILAPGQRLVLEPIGNHCRGTMFLDRNDEIDEDIAKTMINILATIPDVFYGRFDMKVASWKALREGRDIRILEFNGTGSDPAHIYQPGYSLVRAYRDIYYHWDIMYKIARQNRKAGFKRVTFRNIISSLIIYFRHKRTK